MPTNRQHALAPTLAFQCGHKGVRAGALLRGRLLMRCPSCVAGTTQPVQRQRVSMSAALQEAIRG